MNVIAFAEKNVIHFQKIVDSNCCEPFPWFFICTFFRSRLQVSQLESYGVSLGIVHVKTIVVFITRMQYLAESLLSNIRRGKLQ